MEIKNLGKIKFLSFILLFLIIPKFSLSATLYLQPSSKNLNVGDNLIVTVYVDTSEQAINAASGRITWDNSILKYVSHSKSGSIFNFWVREPAIEGNEFVFEGVVFNPGFQGKAGKILTINFKAVKQGETKIDFISGMVLANDGYGTNILKAMIGGGYKITQAQQREEIIIKEEKPLPTNLPSKPVIISHTHPDPNKWYNNNNPVFEWKVPSNVDLVRTAYGKNSDLIPYIEYSPPISRKKLENIPDGTYYFAIQFENELGRSEIARFRFNIDTQQPEITEFSLIPKENALSLKVVATDTLSGLDKAEIYIDDSLYSKEDFVDGVMSKLISGLEGSKRIKVVIKDKANNEVLKEEVVNFKLPERSIIIEREKPESSWIILFSLIIFVILIIIIVLILRIEKAHRHIQEIRWLEFKEKYKDRFDGFIKTMKEEIKNLDQDPRFSEEERNIYRKFKEIIERAEKEFEEYLKKEK
ncbi:MAG: cohesin domain-containing protein [Candidatus Aenigmatarchaeota archaeon]